jgi:hypothetical protein
MMFRGRIKNGVVVFDGAAPLADGTVVDVQPHRDAGEPKQGSAEAIMRHAGFWAGEEDEVQRLLAELKEEKWAEVRAQQDQSDTNR